MEPRPTARVAGLAALRFVTYPQSSCRALPSTDGIPVSLPIWPMISTIATPAM